MTAISLCESLLSPWPAEALAGIDSAIWLIVLLGIVFSGVAIVFARRMERLEHRYHRDVASIGETLKVQEEQSTSVRTEYDALFEHCGAAVLVLDARGRVQRANTAALEMFNASRVESLN